MKQYHKHLEDILHYGTRKEPARERMPGSISLFGYQNRYNLSEGFPILTTKKVNFKNIVVELLWFLRGDTNIKYLIDNGCSIWNEDAYNYYKKIVKKYNLRGNGYTFEEFVHTLKKSKDHDIIGLDGSAYRLGDTGKQYPWLWRSWGYTDKGDYSIQDQGYIHYEKSIDQVKELIEGLKSNPMSRRHIITAWNPATLDDMALNACHAFVQFNCRKVSDKIKREIYQYEYSQGNKSYQTPEYYLDCQLYQRSADMFLGVPYNIASYALLTEIVAKICNMIPGEFIHTFGDSHIYDNHIDQVKEILTRDVDKYKLPKLIIEDDCKDIDRLEIDMFGLQNYQSYPAIKAKLSTGLK